MNNFTEEQLQELETIFNIKRRDTLPVRDGVVSPTSKVWWRCVEGKQHVIAGDHWFNIKKYPSVYQIKEPRTSVIYQD